MPHWGSTAQRIGMTGLFALGIALAALGELGPELLALLGIWWALALVGDRPFGALLGCALALALATQVHEAGEEPLVGLLGEQQSAASRALFAILWGGLLGGAAGFAVSVLVPGWAKRWPGRVALGVVLLLGAAWSLRGAAFDERPSLRDRLAERESIATLSPGVRALAIGDRVLARNDEGAVALLDARTDEATRRAWLAPSGPRPYLQHPCARVGPLDTALEVREVGSILVVTPLDAFEQPPPLAGCAFESARLTLRARDLGPTPAPPGLADVTAWALALALAALLLAAWRQSRFGARGVDATADGRGQVRTADGRLGLLAGPAGPVVVWLAADAPGYRSTGLPTATLIHRGTRAEFAAQQGAAIAGALSLALGLAVLALVPVLALALATGPWA